MNPIQIPKQLQNKDYRFLRLSKHSKVPIPGYAWKEGKLEFNNILLTNHLEEGGNYGVIGGHGNLCLLDIDDGETSKKLSNELNTFTIKTCGGTNHFYFTIIDGTIENSVLKNGVGEVRAKNYYVVGPNCYAIDNKKGHEGSYEIVSNMPIREITKKDFEKIIEPYVNIRESSEVRELFVDDFKDKKHSRSETEFGEVIKQIKQGKTQEQIYSYMMAFAKWSSAPQQYRDHTYKNALSKVPIIPSKNISELKNQYWKLKKDDKSHQAIGLLTDYIVENKNIYTIKDDVKTEIWYYEDGIYLPNGLCEIKEWVEEFLGDFYTITTANKIKEKIIAKTYINQDNFFENNYPHIVPLQNGLFNLLTGELEDFDKDKIFFSKLNVKYIPDSKIIIIEKFFRDIIGDDEKTYLTVQEFFGYCLYKDYSIQKAIMMLGGGSNGKSKILNVLSRLIGAENISTLSLDQMDSKGFATSQLFGKMANICGELKSKTLEDTDVFKQITGGELIGADRKFKSFIYFKNYAKLISSANKLPKTKDLSDGFFRRWIILDFGNKFIDDENIYNSLSAEYKKVNNVKLGDSDIVNKICTPEEIEGLFNWSYQGLKRLLKNQKYSCDDSIENKRTRWVQKSSSFADFANSYIKKSSEKTDFIFRDDVNKQYLEWCDLKELSKKERESVNFQNKMMQDIFNVGEIKKTNVDSFGPNQKMAYTYITMGGL